MFQEDRLNKREDKRLPDDREPGCWVGVAGGRAGCQLCKACGGHRGGVHPLCVVRFQLLVFVLFVKPGPRPFFAAGRSLPQQELTS